MTQTISLMANDPNRFDDLFATFGLIALRRMFGAEGIYRDRQVFGLVYGERIFLKVDKDTRANFEAEGSGPLAYKLKNAEGVLTSYYELPDRLYDDPDELAEWARAALAAALRSTDKKKKAPAKAAVKAKAKPKSKRAKKPAKEKRR